VQLIFDPDHNKMIKNRSVAIIKLERVGASLRNDKFVASNRPLAAPLYTLYIPVARRHSSDFEYEKSFKIEHETEMFSVIIANGKKTQSAATSNFYTNQPRLSNCNASKLHYFTPTPTLTGRQQSASIPLQQA